MLINNVIYSLIHSKYLHTECLRCICRYWGYGVKKTKFLFLWIIQSCGGNQTINKHIIKMSESHGENKIGWQDIVSVQ